MSDSLTRVRVKRISFEADSINSYELISPDGGDLAPFTAGSHIDLHLPNGMIRSYSLVNDQSERNRYLIAVNNDAASRGGSKMIHETMRVGDVLTISHPRNNFVLQEDADHSVLIAGGIGITPLFSMIRRLEALGRSWELFYAARTQLTAAFLAELKNLRPDIDPKLHLNFDGEPPAHMIDLSAIVKAAAPDAHLQARATHASICHIPHRKPPAYQDRNRGIRDAARSRAIHRSVSRFRGWPKASSSMKL